MDQIQDIFRDSTGQGAMRNQNLQKKTEEVQNEFEALMNEMINKRTSTRAENLELSSLVADGF